MRLLRGLVIAVISACSASREPPPAPEGPTFASAIEPLVRDKCQQCHQDGGIAPFSLVTYEQVASMAALAKEKVASRTMPPWAVFDEPDCKMPLRFSGDLTLTDAEVDLFARWVDGGRVRGTSAVPPAAPRRAAVLGLEHSTHRLDVASSFRVTPGGDDALLCFPVDPGVAADTWIAESVVLPADPRVVHHALVYIDEAHEGMTKAAGKDSYPCFGGPDLARSQLLLAWSPGGASTVYGQDAAVRLPKGAHLVVQVHYHPIGEEGTGKLALELRALPGAPAHPATFGLIGNAQSAKGDIRLLPGPDDPPEGPAFLIPSNAKAHTEAMEIDVPANMPDIRISAVGAHMHFAGVGMRIEVDHAKAGPGEPAHECLLSAPKYDFTWQRTYTFDAPVEALPKLRAGDRLRITCTYDNTAENPLVARLMQEQRQSTPPPIRFGASARDEMCQAILAWLE